MVYAQGDTGNHFCLGESRKASWKRPYLTLKKEYFSQGENVVCSPIGRNSIWEGIKSWPVCVYKTEGSPERGSLLRTRWGGGGGE